MFPSDPSLPCATPAWRVLSYEEVLGDGPDKQSHSLGCAGMCNVFLSGLSAWSALTERFSYSRQTQIHRDTQYGRDKKCDYINNNEKKYLCMWIMSCAFKFTTTSSGSQTASSFMNRHTACVRVTTQSTAMTHFLCVLPEFVCMPLFILRIQLQPSAALNLFISSQLQCLVYFWICMPVYLGSVLLFYSCFMLMWMFGEQVEQVFRPPRWVGQLWVGMGALRGQWARRAPLVSQIMLSRQLASVSAHRHKHGPARAQREGSC